MSLRARLLLFFVGIVVIPMLAVAAVLYTLVRGEERGEARARLDVAGRAAAELYEDGRARAAMAGELMGGDAALAAALRAGDRVALRRRVEELATRTRAVRARLTLPRGAPVDVGPREVVAPADTRIVEAGGRGAAAATLTTAVISADEYAVLLSRVTGLEVAVWDGGRLLASTVENLRGGPLPSRDQAKIRGTAYAVRGFAGRGFEGLPVAVRVLDDKRGGPGALGRVVRIVGLGLLAVLLLALVFWWSVVRALGAETERLLQATRRIGRGEFGAEVPVEGHDEFAGLGRQFNAMSHELERRLDELQRERARLQLAIRRVGESFARGLDRSALLETVVKTAVDGAAATSGRARMRAARNGRFDEVVATGAVEESGAALNAAEAAVLIHGQPAEVSVGGASALAQALRSGDGDGHVLGLLSIARPGRPFSDAERELFEYLSNQASVSVENVDLHETMQRQAVTDDLTGLSNHRRFQEVVASEIERSRRFGDGMALVMLDIDDFKQVNDSFGHLQGDEVLRAVAGVVRDSAREIDEPARYGGEELAVVLPQTSLDGAHRFAERLRTRIAALEVPLLTGEGTVSVTASCGVAALNMVGASGKDALVAAADGALYAAKRAGKNRTVKAQ